MDREMEPINSLSTYLLRGQAEVKQRRANRSAYS